MPKIREVSEDNKAERQAVNSIIQGTASDVVKMAMIGIERAIVLQEKKEAAERKERRTRKLTEKEKEKEKEEKGKEAEEEKEEKEKEEEEKTTGKGKEEEKGKDRRTKEGDSPPAHDLDELLAIEEQMMAEAEQENNDQREREAKPKLKKEERKEEKEKEKEEAEEKEEREGEAEEKEKKGYSAALLLQIHDELVYEVRDDMIDWIEDVILNNMEGIQIPIPVDDEPKKEEGEAGDSQTRQIVFPVRLFLGSRFGSMRSFPLKPANQEERYHKKSTARSNTNTEAAPPSRGGIGEEQASDMILEDWLEPKQLYAASVLKFLDSTVYYGLRVNDISTLLFVTIHLHVLVSSDQFRPRLT